MDCILTLPEMVLINLNTQVYLHYKINVKVKVKLTLEQATKAQRGEKVYRYSSFNLVTEWGRWSTPRPCRLTPGLSRYPLYRALVGPPDRSGRVRQFSSPLGFDPRTVQPAANRYTE